MWTEWRSAHGPVLTAATAVVAALVYVGDRTRNVALWSDLDHAIAYASVLVSPLAAAVAVWRGGRDRTCGVEETMRSGVRPIARHLRPFVAMIGSVAAGLLLAEVLLGGWILLDGPTFGGPRPQFALPTIAVAAAAIAVGYSLGRRGPRVIVAPLVALAAYLAQWAATLVPAVGSFVPFPETFFGPALPGSTPTAVWLSIFFAAAAVVIVAVNYVRQRPRAAVAVGVAGLLAGAGSGVAVAGSHGWVEPLASPPYDCTTGQPVEVCLHVAYRSIGTDLQTDLARSLRPIAGADGAPVRVTIGGADVGWGDATATLAVGLATLDGVIDPAMTRRFALNAALSRERCGDSQAAFQLGSQRSAIAAWLGTQDGPPLVLDNVSPDVADMVTQLDGRQPAAALKRIRAHLAGIQACDAAAIRGVFGASAGP